MTAVLLILNIIYFLVGEFLIIVLLVALYKYFTKQ